jgi:hypothetical protein
VVEATAGATHRANDAVLLAQFDHAVIGELATRGRNGR